MYTQLYTYRYTYMYIYTLIQMLPTGYSIAVGDVWLFFSALPAAVMWLSEGDNWGQH